MKKFYPYFSLVLPGSGQVLQKRYIYGALIFLLMMVFPWISSLTKGSPDFNTLSVLNPIVLLLDSLGKNSWTTGSTVLIITLFCVLLSTTIESVIWCKKNTR
ncbi:hypothetical protein JW890_03700 [candidate division WOR-3 bacterium]|nr:hypothetical protein [candidate division WOR-3 bacterium]